MTGTAFGTNPQQSAVVTLGSVRIETEGAVPWLVFRAQFEPANGGADPEFARAYSLTTATTYLEQYVQRYARMQGLVGHIDWAVTQ